jgi:hypothetical protein
VVGGKWTERRIRRRNKEWRKSSEKRRKRRVKSRQEMEKY